MKGLVLFFLILFGVVRAEIIFDDTLPPSQEEMIDYDSIQMDDNDDIPPSELRKKSSDILKDVKKMQIEEMDGVVQTQNIYLNVIKIPKKAIKNQRIKITIKATITRDDVVDIKSVFTNQKSIKVYNNRPIWKKIDDNTYKVDYYIKFISTKYKKISLKVVVLFKNGLSSTAIITLPKVNVVPLSTNRYFCGVLADDFKLLTKVAKKYDDNLNIILMEINATNSNLDDFKIPYAIKSGVDEIIESNNNQKAYSFAIVTNYLKKFKFSYFNTKTNHYEVFDFDIVTKDQTVSTQTDLNPHKSEYLIYKTIALLIVAFIFLIIFIQNKSYIVLTLVILLLFYVGYINLPMRSITLQKGVKLKILPTQNSTIFYIVPYTMEADIAYERKGYYKVILPNQKIGWVKK